jgi:hypothetical protein
MKNNLVDEFGNEIQSAQEQEMSPADRLFAEIFMNQSIWFRTVSKAQFAAMDVAMRFGSMNETDARRAVHDEDHDVQQQIVDPMMGLVAEILEMAFNEMVKHAEFADRAEAFDKKFKVVSALPDANGNGGIPVFHVPRGKPWRNR